MKINLKSGAILSVDELGNVWFNSDIDVVLGKLDNNRFISVPRQEISRDLLFGIAELIPIYEKYIHSLKNV
mgnify:CR=1 FL=1